MKILDRLHKKKSKFYSMNEATIRIIGKNEDSIRKSVATGSSTSMSRASYVRDVALENMEKALMI